jgi:hypothetical protein
VRIVLEEHVVVTVVEDQPVGIVDPVVGRSQMYGRKVGVGRQRGHAGPFSGCAKHTEVIRRRASGLVGPRVSP